MADINRLRQSATPISAPDLFSKAALFPALRNLAIALGVSITALYVGAGAQELLVRLVPAARATPLGAIDIGSWFGFITVFVSFFLAAILETRWLRSKVILPWLLLGPVLFTLIMYAGGLRVSGCIRHWSDLPYTSKTYCAMTTVLLLWPLLGTIAGFSALRLWQRAHR